MIGSKTKPTHASRKIKCESAWLIGMLQRDTFYLKERQTNNKKSKYKTGTELIYFSFLSSDTWTHKHTDLNILITVATKQVTAGKILSLEGILQKGTSLNCFWVSRKPHFEATRLTSTRDTIISSYFHILIISTSLFIRFQNSVHIKKWKLEG